MEAKVFKEKANQILTKMLELADVKFDLKDNWEKDYKESPDYEIKNQIREFVHLVYAFDKDMPLYQELKNYVYPQKQIGERLEVWRKSKVSWYAERIRFFIHYIEEYVEVKRPAPKTTKYERW